MGGTASGAIAAIILAAGRSARMDAHKLLLPLNGKPLLAWSIAAACDSTAHPVTVTLGRAADEVAAALPTGPYTIVVNQRYVEGMGTSLACAVACLPPTATGALILLGDQPFMPTAVIDAVLAAARAQPARIVMGAYGQRQGHPVYLPRRVFDELLALRDDAGARTIITREADAVIRIPLAGEDALFDVDTLADYQQAQEIARRLAQSAENTPS